MKHNQRKLKTSLEKSKCYSKRVWKLSGATDPPLPLQSLCRINRWNKLPTFGEIFTVRFPEMKVLTQFSFSQMINQVKRKIKPTKTTRDCTCARTHLPQNKTKKNKDHEAYKVSLSPSTLNKQLYLPLWINELWYILYLYYHITLSLFSPESSHCSELQRRKNRKRISVPFGTPIYPCGSRGPPPHLMCNIQPRE